MGSKAYGSPFAARSNASGRLALGIPADANDSLASRWPSIATPLKESECELPDNPRGPRNLQVGVWLMPGNQHPGELEDFVADLVPPADRIWPRAEELYIDDIPCEDRLFPQQKTTRAQVHAWLATRPKPRPMGLGIASGDFITTRLTRRHSLHGYATFSICPRSDRAPAKSMEVTALPLVGDGELHSLRGAGKTDAAHCGAAGSTSSHMAMMPATKATNRRPMPRIRATVRARLRDPLGA